MNPIKIVPHQQGYIVCWNNTVKIPTSVIVRQAIKIDSGRMSTMFVVTEPGFDSKILTVVHELLHIASENDFALLFRNFTLHGIFMRSKNDAITLQDELLKIHEWILLVA